MKRGRWVLATTACLALIGAELPTAGGFDGSYRARLSLRADSLYKSPISLALTRDGSALYVVCENSGELLRVDPTRGAVTGCVRVGRKPFAVALSPDERRAYVTNRWDNTITAVDCATMTVERTIATGFNPHGIVADSATLVVANMSADNITTYDARTGAQAAVLASGRQPFALVRDPTGSRIACTSQLSMRIAFRETPRTEITFVDTRRWFVSDRRTAMNCVIQQGAAWTPDGRFLLVATEIPRNLIPETQIYQGWMVTYGLAIAEARSGGGIAYLLIDDMNCYYADPFGVVVSPDGRFVYVSSSGADLVTVLDWEAMRRVIRIDGDRIGIRADTIARYSRHLAMSEEYVLARIPAPRNPKGMAVSPDGSLLYVAARLADSISIIDTQTRAVVRGIDLGGPREVTLLRQGERLFNYASISFQKQLSCNTCHPENGVDGLLYDIAADGGMGRNIVDNRTMRGVAMTAPFKWSGKNPTIDRQEGPRAAQLFFRSHGFAPEGVHAISRFIESLSLPPNPYRVAELTSRQERGKRLFERTRANTGAYIPIGNRCVTCHPAPLYTNRAKCDVGTRLPHDSERMFDTPQLNRIHESPPYLHDGRCWSVEEIWTLYNANDLHGQTNDMTKEQLNDLIDFLKTL